MDTILLDIPGVPGQSTIKGFIDKIELLSFSHGVSLPMTSSPSAADRTSGRPNHQDLSVSKYVDLSTCLLINACNKATNLKTVKLTVGRNDTDGTLLAYLVITMENTMVSSVSTSGGGGGLPMESISFNYSKITWDFTEQKKDVGKKGNNQAVWDLSTNAAA